MQYFLDIVDKVRQQIAKAKQNSIASFTFKINSTEINYISDHNNMYAEFLDTIMRLALHSNVEVGIHFVYQKVKRVRFKDCRYFEREVYVTFLGDTQSNLNLFYEKIKQFVSPSVAEELIEYTKLEKYCSFLVPKDTLEFSNISDFSLKKIASKYDFYIKSFISSPANNYSYIETPEFYCRGTVANIASSSQLFTPPQYFLKSLHFPPKRNIEFLEKRNYSELLSQLKVEYLQNAIPRKISHAFPSIGGEFFEFLQIQEGMQDSVFVVNESIDYAEKLKFKNSFENNLFRHSPGHVDLGESNPIGYNVKQLNNFSCFIPTEESYAEFWINILTKLADTPVSFSDKKCIEALVYDVDSKKSFNFFDECFPAETLVTKNTLKSYFPSTQHFLIDQISETYQINSDIVHRLTKNDQISLTKAIDFLSGGPISIEVGENNLKAFSFILNHILTIDPPKYKGTTFYLHIDASLLSNLEQLNLVNFRLMRRWGIAVVVYGTLKDWEKLMDKRSDFIYLFSTFFINSSVLNSKSYTPLVFEKHGINIESKEELKDLEGSYYFVQNFTNTFSKKCIVKI